jgi:hypothetical protein
VASIDSQKVREALAALVTERETLGERNAHMLSVWDVLAEIERLESEAPDSKEGDDE